MRQKAFERNLMRSPIQPDMIEWIREVEHKNINDAIFLQKQKDDANRLKRQLAKDQANAAAIRASMGIPTPAPPAVPKTNFTAENLAFLNMAAKFSRGREPTELEKASTALNAAEKLGKKKKPANSSRRAAGRRRSTRKTTRRTRRGKRT
jgi:hypothetical protein